MNSMLHMKGGGNMERSNTIMSSVTLSIKELRISVEQSRVVTTFKYNQTMNILFSVAYLK